MNKTDKAIMIGLLIFAFVLGLVLLGTGSIDTDQMLDLWGSAIDAYG